MPTIITCAVCDAQLSVPTAEEVYGAQNPFEGEDAQHPVVNTPQTGWRWTLSEYYLCELHGSILADFKKVVCQHQKRMKDALQAAEAAFLRADPTPTLADFLKCLKQA